MEILIRNSDSQPIYEQIVRQISGQILSGALPPGSPLPSIRALARDLKISVITTKRAYDELEAAGYLVTVAGKGSSVSSVRNSSSPSRRPASSSSRRGAGFPAV